MILETGKNKGFTLVEVIISIGILSFGLILILQGFAQSLNNISVARNNLQASLLADEITTQFLIDSKNLEYGIASNLTGETESGNTKYSWNIKAAQDKEQAELHEILSTVSWVSGRRKGRMPVYTYLRVRVDEEE
jgi:prepilin-type N-terminal cleavage/methylation domain-containing protein